MWTRRSWKYCGATVRAALDEIVMALPNYSWGQIFVAVDCMSRDGLLCLSPLGPAPYQISLGSLLPYDLNIESNS
jgi:hypothetical protein